MGRTFAGIPDGLRGAFATPDLRRLQVASVASCTGGWTFMVGLSVYAYGAGGATAVGLAAFVRMLPAGLAAPFVGLVADRRSRRDVLAVSCAGRAVALVAIAGLVPAGAPLAAVLVLAALVTVLQSAQRPAQAALLALLARTPQELAAANAAWSGLDNASFLVGALIGGALIGATGTTVVFAVTAALFVVATVALARVRHDPVPEYRAGAAPGMASHVREVFGGLRAVRADPALSLVVGTVAVTTFVEGIVDVLVVVSALTILHLGDAGAGWLNAAWGAGGLAGGAVALALLHRARLASGLALGAVLAGVALLGVAALPAPAAALVLLVVFGIGYALVDVAELTLVQRLASDELLARAFGVTETLYWITTALGAALAPLLIAWLGVRGALAASGAGLLVLVAVRARRLAGLAEVRTLPERAFALLRGVSFLAAVPLATLEGLARQLQPAAINAGETVAGDRFCVVDSGTLYASAGGGELVRLAAGDSFGEAPAAAGAPAVVAAAPVRLYTIGREELLAALGSGVVDVRGAAEDDAEDDHEQEHGDPDPPQHDPGDRQPLAAVSRLLDL
jgi:MFS family permease